MSRRPWLLAELENLDEGLFVDMGSEEASYVPDAPAWFLVPGSTWDSAKSWALPIPFAFILFILIMLLVGASGAALVFQRQVSQLW